jgi:hypothetical protein
LSRYEDKALLAIDGVSHWAAFELLTSVEVPKELAVFGIGCYYRSRAIGVEDDTVGGGYQATGERVTTDIGISQAILPVWMSMARRNYGQVMP